MDTSILATVPIFADLDEDALDKIAELMRKRTYPKNKMILMEEDEGDTLFVIDEGSVKITRISEDGREVILSMLNAGDFFGEMSIFDGESRSANVVTLEESDVFLLKRADFLHLLEKYPKISVSLLQELASRLRKSDELIESLSLSDAENRIALTLLRLADDLGIYKAGKVEIDNLPYQQDIANMAGTSRETVSRTLKLLEDKGFIAKDGHKVVIHDYNEFKKHFS
ncbi:MAG: Crp/Fnr family transcriptional regulator [Candidatus Marinimicrobia bacterium]|nr:Crp/Fnr family transcriptional regulator [Candidatus Neomarinimicrobiota bacterium]MCF7828174.1 Crp/Fnr family transcriptional regulator [Candidatus Neomarinimicrobiota bacterium]MCF7879651.1 Crp/Fnr family transcriptional regulator [Candidatus Neomarinimicrobiota bacterium]